LDLLQSEVNNTRASRRKNIHLLLTLLSAGERERLLSKQLIGLSPFTQKLGEC
jgi:hypothetical protein